MVKAGGDVKAIAARLDKERKIRIHDNRSGGATCLWTGGPVAVAAAGGVTPAPGPPAAPVTPKARERKLRGDLPLPSASPSASQKVRPRKMPQDRRSPFPGAERYGFYGRV